MSEWWYIPLVSLYRFYCPSLQPPDRALDAELGPDESRHALTTLRLRSGDRVELFDGAGGFAVGELIGDPAPERGRHRSGPVVRIRVVEFSRSEAPRRRLTLFIASPKGPRFDWLIEKCTELGVTALIFTDFERSVVRTSADSARKHERATIEASKQCGRLWLPTLRGGDSMKKAVEAHNGPLVVCDPGPAARSLTDWLGEQSDAADIGVIIGPEGGISPAESDWLRERGVQPVKLAQTILRIETAGVAAAAIWSAGNCDAPSP